MSNNLIFYIIPEKDKNCVEKVHEGMQKICIESNKIWNRNNP